MVRGNAALQGVEPLDEEAQTRIPIAVFHQAFTFRVLARSRIIGGGRLGRKPFPSEFSKHCICGIQTAGRFLGLPVLVKQRQEPALNRINRDGEYEPTSVGVKELRVDLLLKSVDDASHSVWDGQLVSLFSPGNIEALFFLHVGVDVDHYIVVELQSSLGISSFQGVKHQGPPAR